MSRLRKILKTAIAFMTTSLASSAFAAAGAPTAVLEISPFRAALGQPALRGELRVLPQVAAGFSYEQAEWEGERPDVLDSEKTFQAEALWYPYTSGVHAPFLGLGVAFTEARTGRQTYRDTMTWVRPDSDEIHDRWVNEDRHVSWRQTIGYRFLSGAWLTASLRFSLDQLISSESRVTDEQILSTQRDTTSLGRKTVRQHFLLHAGISFP